MMFGHDSEQSLVVATQLANSALSPDSLTSVDELHELLEPHGYTGRVERTAAELTAVREVRADLRAMLVAERDEAVTLVNEHLAEHRALPQLVRHGEHDWHIHAVDPDAPLHVRIVVETAMAMVDVIRSEEHSRLSLCDDTECDGVVLDLSRNRSRRYCSTACGNRNAVAAYRRRQSET